ncbi:MAG TPA: hypothetical protein VM901_08145 [Bdellovibrionota bacterium]|jgi:hypothetical protein|nr:hypothetical protein [Bdellovibrionota bacterium]
MAERNVKLIEGAWRGFAGLFALWSLGACSVLMNSSKTSAKLIKSPILSDDTDLVIVRFDSTTLPPATQVMAGSLDTSSILTVTDRSMPSYATNTAATPSGTGTVETLLTYDAPLGTELSFDLAKVGLANVAEYASLKCSMTFAGVTSSCAALPLSLNRSDLATYAPQLKIVVDKKTSTYDFPVERLRVRRATEELIESDWSHVFGFVRFGGDIYFKGWYGKLFKITGTGVYKLPELNPGTTKDNLWEGHVLGDKLYYRGFPPGAIGYYWFYTDGTSVHQLSQLRTVAGDVVNQSTVLGEEHLYFHGVNAAGGWKLYRLNADEMEQLTDVFGAGQRDHLNFNYGGAGAEIGDYFYYRCATAAWITDSLCRVKVNGSSQEVELVAVDNKPVSFTKFNGDSYFFSTKTGSGRIQKIVHSTGVPSVVDVCPSMTSTTSFGNLVNVNDEYLVYLGNGIKVLKADGTCIDYSNFAPTENTDGIRPAWLIHDSWLYFYGYDYDASVAKLFRINAEELEQVSDTNPGGDDNIWNEGGGGLGVWRGKLYFGSNTPDGVGKLYRFDPVKKTVVQLLDMTPGKDDLDVNSCTGVPPAFAEMNDKLYFTMLTDPDGCEASVFVLEDDE